MSGAYKVEKYSFWSPVDFPVFANTTEELRSKLPDKQIFKKSPLRGSQQENNIILKNVLAKPYLWVNFTPRSFWK